MIRASVSLGSSPNLGNGMIDTGREKIYLKNGAKHRENGPAVIGRDGKEEWFKNGIRHRDNGPAVINTNGTVEYWVNGERVKK